MFTSGTGLSWLIVRMVMLVVVSFVRSMPMTVVQIVDMAPMLDRRVTAVGTVLVLMPFGLEVPSARDATMHGTV